MSRILIIIIFLFSFYETNVFAKATFEASLQITQASSSGPGNSDSRGHRAYRGITFNSDGTKMYIMQSKTDDSADSSADDIFEYDLGTPWDISGTVTYVDEFTVRNKCHSAGKFQQPGDLFFNNDGSKLFMTNELNNSLDRDICEVSLTTNYDVSTGVDANKGVELNGDTSGMDVGQNDAYGISFNSDGTKMFATTNGGNRVYEFHLSTAFDLDTASDSGESYDLSAQSIDNPSGLRFNKDGTMMFVTDGNNGNGVNDVTDDMIHQYSLSVGFDLSSTVTHLGSIDLTAQYESIIGGSTFGELKYIEFNADGSKLYTTWSRFVNRDVTYERILQFSLDCPYGVVTCTNPVSGSDKDMIGVLESYTEMSKRVMKNNIKPVMHRLEWLRRHRKEDNLTNQNLKFNFSNEMLASLAKVMPIANKESSSNEEQKGDWFFWSEGQISIGDIEATSGSSGKEIDTNSITIGADKKVSENKMYGYALQFGRDSADIGSSAALLDTDNYSLVFYGTLPHEDGRFLDLAVGVSTLETNHLRKKDSSILKGRRDGKQAFGSIKLNKIYYKKNFNINPTARVDLGFTELATFQESGSADALIYENHQIPKGFANLGMVFDTYKKFDNGSILKPMGRLEYIADFSPSTNTNVSYVSDSGTDYFVRIGNQSTHNYKAGLGFDLSTIAGWSMILNYEIDYANGGGHTDNLNFTAGWVPNRNTEYALSISGSENIKTGLNIVKNVRDFNLKFNIDTDLLNNNKDHNANISINKVF